VQIACNCNICENCAPQGRKFAKNCAPQDRDFLQGLILYTIHVLLLLLLLYVDLLSITVLLLEPGDGYRKCNNNNTCLTALCPGLPVWASTRKLKPIWILLKQETVGGSGISWAICKSAPRPRQIPVPAPHHSVFTGRMPLLPLNQQMDIESSYCKWEYLVCKNGIIQHKFMQHVLLQTE